MFRDFRRHGGSLPGDPVTDAEISDLKLLNRLDQIESIVLDSAALTDDNIEDILTVADQRKKELLAVQPDSPTWEGNLLEALETSAVIRRGKSLTRRRHTFSKYCATLSMLLTS